MKSFVLINTIITTVVALALLLVKQTPANGYHIHIGQHAIQGYIWSATRVEHIAVTHKPETCLIYYLLSCSHGPKHLTHSPGG